jgi:hypothetical protein
MIKTKRLTITPIICQAYELYFGFKVNHQDKIWAHHYGSACYFCVTKITGMSSRYKRKILYLPSAQRPIHHNRMHQVPKFLPHNNFSHMNNNDSVGIYVKYVISLIAVLHKKIDYHIHYWQICGDFKVIGILTGSHSGYTKHCCFLCEWDSRVRVEHYKRKK